MKQRWISILSRIALPPADFSFGVGEAPADAGKFTVPDGFLPDRQKGE